VRVVLDVGQHDMDSPSQNEEHLDTKDKIFPPRPSLALSSNRSWCLVDCLGKHRDGLF
jgi:hypothetical protein